MNKDEIGEELKGFFRNILSTDIPSQQSAIQLLYDQDCQLVNPYLVLHGRDEIAASYRGQSRSNLAISVEIHSVSYDSDQQIAMVDLHQTLRPKDQALGGLLDVTIHEILKLQLEQGDQGLYRIVHHSEIHAAQDFISQMPILGSWYDGSLRSAFGQMTLAGTQILDHVGLLDLIPSLAQKTRDTAQSVVSTASALTSSATALSSKAVSMTGVPSVMSRVVSAASGAFQGASSKAKWGASVLRESGRGIVIDCYSPTCIPGSTCYSPTCQRGSNVSLLSADTLQDIVRGAYLGLFQGERQGFLTPSVALL